MKKLSVQAKRLSRGWKLGMKTLYRFLPPKGYSTLGKFHWVCIALACSRRSDSRARERNFRIKKNAGRLEGERGRQCVLSLSPPPPPTPVFPVYNLTRSPLTAALYYLNTWNRLVLHAFWNPEPVSDQNLWLMFFLPFLLKFKRPMVKIPN